MNKIPSINNFESNICIICEGFEEYKYLERIRELKVWNPIYGVDLVNAKGNGNLPARYQAKYQEDKYDVVLIFCDTDKSSEQYHNIKHKIDKFHGITGICNKVIIFGNPCTMQIIIKHFTNQNLKSQAKHTNAKIIEKYTNIKDYDAHEEQCKLLMELINQNNYKTMLSNVSKLSKNDTETGSSNFDIYMNYLNSPDKTWIQEINNKIESE